MATHHADGIDAARQVMRRLLNAEQQVLDLQAELRDQLEIQRSLLSKVDRLENEQRRCQCWCHRGEGESCRVTPGPVVTSAATTERFTALLTRLVDLTKEKEAWITREASLVETIDTLVASHRLQSPAAHP